MSSTPTISIVIPVLNEAALVESAVRQSNEIADEVIVVDGGSSDETTAIAGGLNCRLVDSPKGRGQQLFAGAAAAESTILLFLHVDTSLPSSARTQILEAWDRSSPQQRETLYGCFRQKIESNRRLFRWIEAGNYWRAKHQKLPYGDQGIFVCRKLYDRVEGMPQIPLMEDFEFARRVSRFASPTILPGPISIDARRWEKTGPIRQTIRNWLIAARYRMGADPESLLSKY